MKELLVALIGLALAGMTTLAYKRPREYRRLAAALSTVLTIAGVFAAGWIGGMSAAISALEPHIGNDKAKGATAALRQIIPDQSYVWVYACCVLYMLFLIYLPEILGKQPDEHER